MISISQYITESTKRTPIRKEAIEDWNNKYRGGKYWTAYLKDNPQTITSICAALVGKDVDNWNGRKGVISDFVNMFFCGYLGKTQEPFVKTKDFIFNKEEGTRTCTCIAYDKWNGGEVAQFTFTLKMDDEKSMRAYKHDNFDKMGKRSLIVTCDVAKYKKDETFNWKHVGTPIIKMEVPPISNSNRDKFHTEIIKQMLDAAHYMDWGKIDPRNNSEE